MAKEGTAAWYYEQAIRLRVLATKAANPQIQFELMQAATRFRVLASDIEIGAEKKRRARQDMVAAAEPAATADAAASKR
jgi:hypothetical protein